MEDFVPVELEVDRYHNRGVGYFNAREWEKAIEMFNKEIDCDPEGCISYWFLAKTLREMDRVEEARKYYNIALEKAEKMRALGPDMIDIEMIDAIRKDSDSLGSKKDSACT